LNRIRSREKAKIDKFRSILLKGCGREVVYTGAESRVEEIEGYGYEKIIILMRDIDFPYIGIVPLFRLLYTIGRRSVYTVDL
jgi:hypothetical protein